MKHLKRVTSGETKGDIALVDGRSSVEESTEQTAISLESRFRFFKGAWFLNEDEGIPYFAVFFGKGRDHALIRSMLIRVAETHPDIVGVSAMTVRVPDAKARKAVVTFAAKSRLGSVGPAEPLIIG